VAEGGVAGGVSMTACELDHGWGSRRHLNIDDLMSDV
jgi:hypothetical protein